MPFAIILDLDETLVYSVIVNSQGLEMQHILNRYKNFPLSSISLSNKKTCLSFYRPFLLGFLTHLKSYFHFVVLFSLGEEEYVHSVAKDISHHLDDATYFDLILTQKDCYKSMRKYQVYKSPEYVKDQIYKKYHYSNLTIPFMIDDNPIHKIMNSETKFFQCQPFHPPQLLPTTWNLKENISNQWLLKDKELARILHFIAATFRPL